ncbi:thioesterase II family protein [Nocardia tengchongensis]|uniref:thioesterase II family protein n=1 Tax=Nocardia tengchongensis TaxID=2055889 RepID=UPI0036BF2D6F
MTGYLEPAAAAADSASLRLFCFHHAGGGASGYRTWQRALGPHTAVRPVLLPGRERRSGEARFDDLEPLIADLDVQLDEHLTEPYVFFGHSMGALLAYRLAAWREHTTALSEVRILPGDHFFLFDRPDDLFDHLRPLLSGCVAARNVR